MSFVSLFIKYFLFIFYTFLYVLSFTISLLRVMFVRYYSICYISLYDVHSMPFIILVKTCRLQKLCLCYTIKPHADMYVKNSTSAGQLLVIHPILLIDKTIRYWYYSAYTLVIPYSTRLSLLYFISY